MAHQGRRSADQQLRLALACGATVAAAAHAAGVSDRTAHRRLRSSAFRRSVQDLRTEILQRSAAALSAASSEAVKTLLELQKASSAGPVRLGAARAILEIGMRLREVTELEGRIAALEEQLAGGNAAA